MSLETTLSAAASEDFAHYKPQPVIDAVNALLPLGKAGALAAIDSFLATKDLQRNTQGGLFLVLRVLFEVPADTGYHLPLQLGGSSPPPPPTPAALPHFPLVLIDDRPLLLISGYALGGDTEPLSAQVSYFRGAGKLRASLLKPSGSPPAVLAEFKETYRKAYGQLPSPQEIALIEEQLR